MKKTISLFHYIFSCILIITLVSCSDDNDDLIVEPGSEFDAEIIVTENEVGDIRTATINTSNIAGTNATVKVRFETNSSSMRRVYITKNISATGEEPFQFTDQQVDDKADGSLDLVGDDKNEFEFQIKFPVPTVSDGTVVYKIWATTGRGDFRDVSKRNALGPTSLGQLTIRAGSGIDSANGIKSYTATMLSAPLGDGSSDTFISLYNNTVYKISDGEEYAALWDFGYYYGSSQKASLASTAEYPALFNHDDDTDTPLVAVSTLTGVDQSELNTFYITTSNIDFDSITSASQLDGITTPSSQRATDLSVNDVLEFEDKYGNKGIIKVIEINGTDGTSGFIKIDIKVQV